MYAKLHATRLGLAAGVLWGITLFFMTWLAIFTGYGMFWLSQWMDIYPGYNLSAVGAFLGLVYGFIDGFVLLFVLGWLYNIFGVKKEAKPVITSEE